MIRRLIILLLIVGCKEPTQPTDCAGVVGGTALEDECSILDTIPEILPYACVGSQYGFVAIDESCENLFANPDSLFANPDSTLELYFNYGAEAHAFTSNVLCEDYCIQMQYLDISISRGIDFDCITYEQCINH